MYRCLVEVSEQNVLAVTLSKVKRSLTHLLLLVRNEDVHELLARVCISQSKHSTLVAIKDFGVIEILRDGLSKGALNSGSLTGHLDLGWWV